MSAWHLRDIPPLIFYIRVSRDSRSSRVAPGSVLSRFGRYAVVVEAIAESALVTWIGLVLYGIGSLAPQGRITVSLITLSSASIYRLTTSLDKMGYRLCDGVYFAYILREYPSTNQ